VRCGTVLGETFWALTKSKLGGADEMRRAREKRDAFAPALVIHDASILLALFYAPIFWGGFGSSGLTMAATLVSVAALCAVVWRWACSTAARP